VDAGRRSAGERQFGDLRSTRRQLAARYVHVIMAGAVGTLTDAQIAAQMAVSTRPSHAPGAAPTAGQAQGMRDAWLRYRAG
jgi:hypothetical protein